MNVQYAEKRRGRLQVLWMIAIVVIAFNLRPAITSVGPLLTMIRDDIGLSNWSAGLITSLPLIAFACTSLFAPKIGQRFSDVVAVSFGLTFLIGGIIIRSIPISATLFIGTAFVGVGVGIMNVLLPAVIKAKFPNKTGTMTSVYTTSMKLFAATASGLSIPLAITVGLGWKLSLGVWVFLGIIGLFFWLIVLNRDKKIRSIDEDMNESVKSNTNELAANQMNDFGSEQTEAEMEGNESNDETAKNHSTKEKVVPRNNSIWKSPIAWQVTLFMGMQSFMFYTVISWLPSILVDYGFTISTAGWLLSYVQFIGLPSAFIAPILAERLPSQSWLIAIIGTMVTVGFGGLLFGGPPFVIIIWVTIIGLSLGATISLSLALLGMRARSAKDASMLSGMAQSFGYFLAAIGPILVGFLYDVFESWHIPLIAIIIICVMMTISGFGAGRNKYVLD